MRELIELWTKLLGETPAPVQFELWLAMYPVDIVRRGILKTAEKNLSLNQTMSQDHKVRFASRVMRTASEASAEHAENRARLAAEMEGRR